MAVLVCTRESIQRTLMNHLYNHHHIPRSHPVRVLPLTDPKHKPDPEGRLVYVNVGILSESVALNTVQLVVKGVVTPVQSPVRDIPAQVATEPPIADPHALFSPTFPPEERWVLFRKERLPFDSIAFGECMFVVASLTLFLVGLWDKPLREFILAKIRRDGQRVVCPDDVWEVASGCESEEAVRVAVLAAQFKYRGRAPSWLWRECKQTRRYVALQIAPAKKLGFVESGDAPPKQKVSDKVTSSGRLPAADVLQGEESFDLSLLAPCARALFDVCQREKRHPKNEERIFLMQMLRPLKISPNAHEELWRRFVDLDPQATVEDYDKMRSVMAWGSDDYGNISCKRTVQKGFCPYNGRVPVGGKTTDIEDLFMDKCTLAHADQFAIPLQPGQRVYSPRNFTYLRRPSVVRVTHPQVVVPDA